MCDSNVSFIFPRSPYRFLWVVRPHTLKNIGADPMPEARGLQALATIHQRLKESYPDARYELDWDTPLQLLVATILAAQCTDERVNAVTRSLFPKYPDARSFAEANTAELEEDIRPT